MARPRNPHPTERELEILQVLWERGPVPLAAVCEDLCRRRRVATTTVATMLQVMLEKGLVKRRDGPRGYLWSARASRERTSTGLLAALIDRAFDGSALRLVAHLVEHGKLTAKERAEIRRLLDRTSGDKGERT